MNKCSQNPIELIVGTTDPNLYDSKTKSWKWAGSMYWAVECLTNEQSTVSDFVNPQLTHFVPLTKTPETWDYCQSKKCTDNSVSMQIVFTFNPNSTTPSDYLQFVINTRGHITDQPHHSIKDKKGQELYLEIIAVNKMVNEPYIEVWIAKSEGVTPINGEEITTSSNESTTNGINYWLWISIILIIILFLFLAIGAWWLWYRKNTKNVGNIG
jgi:hypothetical protein